MPDENNSEPSTSLEQDIAALLGGTDETPDPDPEPEEDDEGAEGETDDETLKGLKEALPDDKDEPDEGEAPNADPVMQELATFLSADIKSKEWSENWESEGEEKLARIMQSALRRVDEFMVTMGRQVAHVQQLEAQTIQSNCEAATAEINKQYPGLEITPQQLMKIIAADRQFVFDKFGSVTKDAAIVAFERANIDVLRRKAGQAPAKRPSPPEMTRKVASRNGKATGNLTDDELILRDLGAG